MAFSTAESQKAVRSTWPAMAWSAFRRTFNLLTVMAVFYLTLLIVFSHTILSIYSDSLEAWILDSVRFLRQSLISSLLVLFGIAAADTVVTLYCLPRRPAVLLAIALAAIASALSMFARTWVYGSAMSNIFTSWAYFLGLWATWTALGGLGYAALYLWREDAASRAQLLESVRRRNDLAVQITQARLSALQAQIEPHFLFNTLANVKRLYETTPERGREMLVSLIDYLRAALPSMRATGSTLAGELDLARSFLTILKLRMGNRLEFTINAPPHLLNTNIPPLVLPTLVENAIKHGLAPLPQGGRIDVYASADSGQLQLQVRDTGAGFVASSGTGLGLANTRSRLAALYGERARLTLTANEPRGVIATVMLPLDMPSTEAIT